MRIWPAMLGPLLLALAGCIDAWDWLGQSGDDDDPLPGERVSVLVLERELEPDPALAAEAVRVPPPLLNTAWPQQGGSPDHALHHLAAGEALREVWSRSVGEGETEDNLILSSPVIADDRIFVVDSESNVAAFALADGQPLWQVDLWPQAEEDDDASLGGGVAYAEGRLFVTTSFGEAAALDARAGTLIWRRGLGTAIRSAPTVADGRVFVLGFDNQLLALDALDGRGLWTHTGIAETAGLLGSAVPAVAGDVVIAPYSSGELFALRVANGSVAWSDSLVFQGRGGARSVLTDIDASPVIYDGSVYAVSHSGRLVALDMRSGLRLWDQEIASAETPWIAGDYLFVVTTDAEVVSLRRADGRVRWVTSLPRFGDPERRRKPIVWTGPVLAGDRLVVLSNTGEARAISPYTGRILGRLELPAGVRVPAVVARGTLYILTVDAELVAFR